MTPLDLEQVEVELATLAEQFEEGEHGLLEMHLDRRLSPDELAHLTQELDGRAFYILSPPTQNAEGVLSIHFQVGIFFLALVPLLLGAIPVGLFAWKLSKMPSEQLLRTLKGIAIPLGAMIVGGGIILVGKAKMPSLIAGGTAMAVGGYLAYRELGPPAPPPPVGKLVALTEYEGVAQPALSVVSM